MVKAAISCSLDDAEEKRTQSHLPCATESSARPLDKDKKSSKSVTNFCTHEAETPFSARVILLGPIQARIWQPIGPQMQGGNGVLDRDPNAFMLRSARCIVLPLWGYSPQVTAKSPFDWLKQGKFI